MKSYLLIRFDRYPREDVNRVLSYYIDEELDKKDQPQFIASPGALYTFFKSAYKFENIYQSLAELDPPAAFFFFDITDTPVALHFPEQVAKPLREYLGKDKKVKLSDIQSEKELKDLRKMNMTELQNLLKMAIDNEEYEKCEVIQNVINEKQNKNG